MEMLENKSGRIFLGMAVALWGGQRSSLLIAEVPLSKALALKRTTSVFRNPGEGGERRPRRDVGEIANI